MTQPKPKRGEMPDDFPLVSTALALAVAYRRIPLADAARYLGVSQGEFEQRAQHVIEMAVAEVEGAKKS